MKKRNEGWTSYLKTDTARQVLWLSVVLSAASLLVAGIVLSLQVQLSSAAQRRPQPETLPSDQFGESHFLIYNGIDDAVSACKYYKAIGAINPNSVLAQDSACDQIDPMNFNFLPPDDGITFDDWKRKNSLDDLTGEVSALYFNVVDLALARSMHGKTSVVNSETRTAYYVCNYNTLEEARDNRNLIACVAFDYSEGQPFTKFYVFNNRGNLVPSANLDQLGSMFPKGEKFVPGLCKACHGGNNRRPFPGPGDNANNGNIGAHFLPFDLDNFDYLEDSMFSRNAQESKFKRLNQMIVTDTAPAPVVEELIKGWYGDDFSRIEQDREFIPPGWKGHEQLYRRVVKPSCRTCHVAMQPAFDFRCCTPKPGTSKNQRNYELFEA
jgi:hypothetical protein